MNEVNGFIDGVQSVVQSIEDTWNKYSGMVADITNLEGAISGIIAGLLATAVVGGISFLAYSLFQS